MQSRSVVLLKTLLRSTSGINVLRYEKDSKKKSKITGGYVGVFFLYLLLAVYCLMNVVGYGMMGLAPAIPVLCAVLVATFELLFTFIKTNGYLFAFKDYDMVMALPFKPSEIAGTRFLYMYIKSLPLVMCISLSMMVGYGIFEKPGVATYFLWIILSAFLPLLPMVVASALGALIAGIGSGFRHKTLVQTILTFILIILAFCSRFFIEAMFKDGKAEEALNVEAEAIRAAAGYYPPAVWFEKAVLGGNVLYALLLVLVSSGLFLAFAALVGRFYRKINSRLMAGVARRNYRMGRQKKKNVVTAIAFKEFKRMTGSTVYITNAAMGQLMLVILTIVALFVDLDSLYKVVLQDAPLTKENLIPAIPFIIYFLLGMMATTAYSLSLEGKNLWIVKSLPIEVSDLLKGKVLFNLYITVPFMLLASLVFGIKSGVSLVNMLLILLLGFILCTFSSLYGMVCNLKFPNYEWENEVEVIKKGTSVAVYLLPNMFGIMAITVAAVALGFVININAVLIIFCVFFALLSFICYKVIVKRSLSL